MRRLSTMGWAGWIMLARRVAPWALLIFVSIEIKTLSEHVKQIEESEFSAVQNEVEGLRKELIALNAGAELARKQLDETNAALKAVNETLAQAKRNAPELAKAINDAHAVSVAVKGGLPTADEAASLNTTLMNAGGQLNEVVAQLPKAEAGAKLASSAAALGEALDAQQKKVDAVSAALPKPEQAATLAKALDGVKASLPTDEQLATLKRDVTRAHDALQRVAEPSRPPEPHGAEPRGSEPAAIAAHAAQ
jgi:chromosome segregation ATPase